jgi:sugar lactone lactonase YvrE
VHVVRELEAEALVHTGSAHSEGPIWDPHGRVVRWVDMFAGSHFAVDLETRETKRWDEGLHLGALATTPSGGLVAAAADGFYELREPDRRWHSPRRWPVTRSCA